MFGLYNNDHARLAQEAAMQDVSLNSYIVEKLRKAD
jgi:predicted HicB family RNase H-like nuclease